MLSAAERLVLYSTLMLASAAAWSVTWLQFSNLPVLSPFLAQVWCGGPWSADAAASSFVMWFAMMVGMMLPAVGPTIDAFATIARRRNARGAPYTPTIIFVAGYCLAWSAFSAAAVAVQWQLYRAATLMPPAQNVSSILAGAALLMAGLYQFAPLKIACLRGCRSPLSFIMTEWRDGHTGALLMGVRHGASCVGCCWAVMSLMFCVSVMDLRWAAALAVYAAAEKLLPGGDTVVAPAFGSAAILGGAALIGWTFL